MPIGCNNCVILQGKIIETDRWNRQKEVQLPNVDITIPCKKCKERSIKEASRFRKGKKATVDSEASTAVEEAGPSKAITPSINIELAETPPRNKTPVQQRPLSKLSEITEEESIEVILDSERLQPFEPLLS